MVALAACWGATYAAGGAGKVAPHWFYLPIILAAAWFGPVGAAAAAVASGLLAGPLMPLDVAGGVAQDPSDWGSRAAFFVGIGLSMAWLVVRGRRAEDALRESRRSLSTLARDLRRGLLARVASAEEEERRRIASNIHDDTIQVMAAALLRIQVLRLQLRESQHTRSLLEVEGTMEDAIARLRDLLFDLWPQALDREGLASALRAHVEHAFRDSGVLHTVDDQLRGEPAPEIRAVLFRLAQEAITNVRKHARPGRVDVLLEERDGGVLVCVEDDGVGFWPEDSAGSRPGHLGLSSMRERAGREGGWCLIRSAPGAGTRVELWLPMGNSGSAEVGANESGADAERVGTRADRAP